MQYSTCWRSTDLASANAACYSKHAPGPQAPMSAAARSAARRFSGYACSAYEHKVASGKLAARPSCLWRFV